MTTHDNCNVQSLEQEESKLNILSRAVVLIHLAMSK